MAGPGRASSRRSEPHISDQAPPVWRAPEGPEGTGGLRDRPLRAFRLACGDLAGGRARRRPEHQRSRKQQAQPRIPAAPPVWRPPRGLQGLAGLRDGASPPSTAGAAGVEGTGGSGGHGRASRSTTPSEARVWRSRGRAAAHGTARKRAGRTRGGRTSDEKRRISWHLLAAQAACQ